MLNIYRDSLVENAGKGSDIASQRLDQLDEACLRDVTNRAQLPKDRSGQPLVFIDAGAGRCGFINRLASLHLPNAALFAVDMEDFSGEALQGVEFLHADVRTIPQRFSSCDVFYSQRTFHYLPYADALALLTALRSIMPPAASLYLSVSGMKSELSQGYGGVDRPVHERHHLLSEEMQSKHGMRNPVCLYSSSELSTLVALAGFLVIDVTESQFGNVKLIGAVHSNGRDA